MRTREKIASELGKTINGMQEQQVFVREILYVLLDIRDLLALHAPEGEKV